MICRDSCGACCIAPSITSPIPGMPDGKPAGIPCIQLDDHYRCKLFGKPERPAVCLELKPCQDMCGQNRNEALFILKEMEKNTQP